MAMTMTPEADSLSKEETAGRIRAHIRRAEAGLVERFPVLVHQDGIGASLCVASMAGMVTLGWLYALGYVPALVCVLGNALFASVLHEIEHDLIHKLYFPRSRLPHNAMMFFVWLFRGNVPHGWYRRAIHFHHHQASGTASDIEERLLGLGMPWGFRRWLVALDPSAAYLLNARRLEREVPGFSRWALVRASLPIYPLFLFVLAGFWFVPSLKVLAVAWVFPNVIRQACLQIITSNVHYYGDVHDVTEETQILRPFYLWPLQLFCFNFGTTHGFHHYVVDQPFYIRQMIAPQVLPCLRALGMRESDTGTFVRANRFTQASAAR